MAIDVRILGSLEISDGKRLVPLRRKKHRALFALLVLRAGETVSADVLVEKLWGEEPPKTARDALHNYVSQLRRELGVEAVQTRDQAYVLAVDPQQVDAFRFERLVADARGAESAEERAGMLREALALWRGPPLDELAYEPFAAAEIGRLEELGLAARKDLIDAELELGRHAELIPQLEALVAEHPFRERLRGQLMLALYRAGRQADALQAYRDARGILLEELGLEPGAALRELEQAILRQDAALDLPSVLPSVEQRRKTVTILFAELPVSGVDPERLRELAVRARATIELYGGSVEARGGDELLGVFGVPAAHEDDALRALRAASELGEDVRVGVDTGEALTGHGFVSGEVLSRAAQLQREAAAGEVRLGKATLALCRDAVVAEPVDRGFRLVEVIEGAPGLARALDTPFVGRAEELTALEAAYVEAHEGGRCRLVVISGEPGIGKTRLARELVARVGDETSVLVGRCASYGAGATWRPLAEMLDQSGDSLEPILAQAGSPGEVFLGVRRVLERLAAEKPLVLAFDDLHWAEPTLLDFVDYLAAHAEGPILCLCLTRERRDGAIVLEPLSDDQAEQLAADVEPELRPRLVDTAGGNPLFLEQLVAFAQEGASLDAVPPSVEALIAARLDLLEPEERGLLQRAAVVGRLFSRAAVQELGADVSRLAPLEGRGLVRRLRSGYRFHHVLVRDVAYASLPKAERAELHERLADWLDGRGEPDELVGYHLEQAFHDREAIGRSDGRARRLAFDAGRRLGAAGIEAWKRGETPATVNLLGRAAALLPERDPYRLELLCELGIARRTGGELAWAVQVLEEAVKKATDRRLELRARLELTYVQLFSDPDGRTDELLDIAAEAIPVFEAVADDRSLGRAWLALASVHGLIRNLFATCADATERALPHYDRSGWPTSTCLGLLAASLYHGPTRVGDAIRRCRKLLAQANLNGEANVLTFLGGLEAMRGRFGEARRLVARAREIYEQLGLVSLAEANCGSVAARIELLAGDEVAAEHLLRLSCDVLRQTGDRAYLATRSAELADVLCLQELDEGAERMARSAEELAAADDLISQVLLRSVRARLHARRGQHDEAEALARSAVDVIDATDALNTRAKVRLDLAEVLRLAGKPVEPREVVEEAIELFERKGNIVTAKGSRGLLAELTLA